MTWWGIKFHAHFQITRLALANILGPFGVHLLKFTLDTYPGPLMDCLGFLEFPVRICDALHITTHTRISLLYYLFSEGQSVLLWSKCCYSSQKGIDFTTLPSLRFLLSISVFAEPSLRELLRISYLIISKSWTRNQKRKTLIDSRNSEGKVV